MFYHAVLLEWFNSFIRRKARRSEGGRSIRKNEKVEIKVIKMDHASRVTTFLFFSTNILNSSKKKNPPHCLFSTTPKPAIG